MTIDRAILADLDLFVSYSLLISFASLSIAAAATTMPERQNAPPTSQDETSDATDPAATVDR
jgi:hypothetical protein